MRSKSNNNKSGFIKDVLIMDNSSRVAKLTLVIMYKKVSLLISYRFMIETHFSVMTKLLPSKVLNMVW